MATVLITGGCGLVGSGLSKALCAKGHRVRLLDVRAEGSQQADVRDIEAVRRLATGCDGIIHLAAVSRVVWAERDPERCKVINIDATRAVIELARDMSQQPWLLFASSREIYGRAAKLPASEETPAAPVNLYGHSKVAGEEAVRQAVAAGMCASTVRLSNVYGSIHDHHDRVIPAFCRGASRGGQLRLEGRGHTFDFTHIDDVSAGLATLVELLHQERRPLPPIHFVSGRATSLAQLSELAIAAGAPGATTIEAPPRDYGVERFCGDNTRARQLLGWTPKVSLEQGVERLVQQFAEQDAPRVDHIGGLPSMPATRQGQTAVVRR